jgi:hypothetical protein
MYVKVHVTIEMLKGGVALADKITILKQDENQPHDTRHLQLAETNCSAEIYNS